jgi:hypothetical protein
VCGAASTADALARIGEIQGNDSMILRARRLRARPPRVTRRGAARAALGTAPGDTAEG